MAGEEFWKQMYRGPKNVKKKTRKMLKISVTTPFWPKSSKTLGKIARTGSLSSPLFASLVTPLKSIRENAGAE